MEIKDKLRLLRKELGLTLEDVGKAVGVGKSTVRKWETGDIENMRRDKIAKLAHILHTTPDYLLGCEDSPKPSCDALAPHEKQLLSIYRSVNGHGQRYIMKQAEFAAAQEEYRPAAPKSGATAAVSM